MYKGEMIECPECGELFLVKRDNQKCCGPDCQAKRLKRLKREANQVAYTDVYDAINTPPRQSLLNELERQAREEGISYGNLKAKEYIEKYGRIKL